MLTITLNQLAIALLGAGAYIYHCTSRGGYWKACVIVCGQRIERNHSDPYCAIAEAAEAATECDTGQSNLDRYDGPAAIAYAEAWRDNRHHDLSSRNAIAVQAAADATEPAACDCMGCKGGGNCWANNGYTRWVKRTEAAPAATVAHPYDEETDDAHARDLDDYMGGYDDDDESDDYDSYDDGDPADYHQYDEQEAIGEAYASQYD